MVLGASILVLSVPAASAHHGPPHDEIDEFDADPSMQRMIPSPARHPISWGVLGVAAVAAGVVSLASQRYSLMTRTPLG